MKLQIICVAKNICVASTFI